MRVGFQRFGGLSPALMNRKARFEADLAPAEESEVRRLIPEEFYRLTPSGASPRGPDMFKYEISIDDGQRKKTVVLSEQDVPSKLRPLIEWLQQKAGVS